MAVIAVAWMVAATELEEKRREKEERRKMEETGENSSCFPYFGWRVGFG